MEPRGRVTVDPRTSLAMWLRAARAERQLTLDDVARVTKIQPRILQKIEAGNLDGLPAEVFVRGFVKSFARCVGLDEGEAVKRYGECAFVVGPTSSVARAFVETLVAAPTSEPAPLAAKPTLLAEPAHIAADIDDVEISIVDDEPPALEVAPPVVIEVVAPAIEVVEVVTAPEKKKRSRKKAMADGTIPPRSRKKKSNVADAIVAAIETAAGANVVASAPLVSEVATESSATPAVASTVDVVANLASSEVVERSIFDAPTDAELAAAAVAFETQNLIDSNNAADDLFAPADGIVIEHDDVAHGSEPVASSPLWQPTMPAIAPSAPWKRPAYKTAAFAMPSLVIDDADPDMAERERDDREAAAKPGPHRVSFLPPILLDREDKSGRQGGLTLAVILLLIAATLTLSYLMRRPSVSGDGVTQTQIDTTSIVA